MENNEKETISEALENYSQILEDSSENPSPVNEEAVPQDETSSILYELIEKMEDLQNAFSRKIERDAHKDQMFDNMHKELVKFQNDIYEKPENSLALDLIQIIDYIKKDCVIYSNGEKTEERYNKLLGCLSSVAQEIEDALYRREIEPYTVPGDTVDVKRQKIISVVETDNPDLVGKVAERLADGYEKRDKILRPERIKAYKYITVENEAKNN